MNFAEFFIRRPIATSLLMVAILLAGLVGYRQLPVSDLPTVDYPTINVRASLSGATPETMASAVATPLENQFASIPGLSQITSTSGQGVTGITLQFALDRNIDAAAQDVQAAIAAVTRSLPKDMLPPTYSKANPADQPIISIALTSDVLPQSKVAAYAQQLLAQPLSTVSGVGQVTVGGGKKFAVRIQLDPRALAYRRIGVDQVEAAINAYNVDAPTGILWGPHRALSLEADGQLYNAEQFRDIVVSHSADGRTVLLGDLGRVIDAVQDTRAGAWYNGIPAVTVNIQRQPGSNIASVADAVRARIDQLRNEFPPSIGIHVLYDRSETIRASVHDVKATLLVTLVLVVLVIFLFLRNVPATLIPSAALPMSLIGTFGVMALLGYSIDNLSMMALTLAVGFVVDDAIVMLENIVRHLEMGKAPLQAALDGSAEVGFTIVSMTLSLAAVFIPVLFMGGLLGRLFHEFAVTIGVAILVSGFVSLTLTPMMSGRLLRHQSMAPQGKFFTTIESLYQKSHDWYRDSLLWVMRHRGLAMVFSALILVATILQFVYTPKGFIPTEDQGQILGKVEGVEGASYDEEVTHLRQAEKVVLGRYPEVAYVSENTGGGGVGDGANHFHVNLYLKPKSERTRTPEQIIADLAPRLSAIPGGKVFLNIPPALQIGGRSSNAAYQYTLQSPDLQALYRYGPMMEERMRSLSGVTDVFSDLEVKSPIINVHIDRKRAAMLGVTPDQVERAFYDAYGTRQISTIYAPTDQYWVILELLPQFQQDATQMNLLTITSNQGAQVPLGAVASLAPSVGPFLVNHTGQLPSVTLTFNTRPGVALGTAVEQVEQLAHQVLPASITGTFSGTAQVFRDSQQGLTFLLVVAVLVIYLVLGMLYESLIHPLTILSGLPFATFGALLTLTLFRSDLNIYAYVGIIMLVGLVKKNAIMMVDFALDAQRDGQKPADAIIEASLVRFRPIMMTTMCALMGTLPIAIGWGAGAESRRPLGLAVVGGLAFSQMVTLYVTPVIYTYMDAFQRWVGERRRGYVVAAEGGSAAAAAD